MKNSSLLGHAMAVITAVIWGTTYISSKVLLEYLTPSEIVLIRFAIAWLALLAFYPKFSRPSRLREELLFLAAGLFGTSLYMLSENTALQYTLASNVSLLATTAPIITVIFAHLFTKDEKLNKNNLFGFILAIAGVFFVIFSGSFVLHISPLGDFLAICAAVIWSVYSMILKKLPTNCHYIVATRKTFFYGVISTLPFVLHSGFTLSPERLLNASVIPNMLFLSLAASSLAYVLWNRAANTIGIVRTSNYIYLIPLVTIVTAAIMLEERMTAMNILGAALILLGVYISDNGFRPLGFKQKSLPKHKKAEETPHNNDVKK